MKATLKGQPPRRAGDCAFLLRWYRNPFFGF
jgi:hypothetical protein